MQLKISERIFLIILFGLLFSWKLEAQEDDGFPAPKPPVVIDRTVDTTGEIPVFGPNRLLYVTPFFQLAEIPGPQIYGSQTNWWSSSLTYGVRTKVKLFYWNAFVIDVDYRYDRFSINQKTPKLYPLMTTAHERERISLHNLSGTFCDRINFHKRGNVIGNYIEFGVYGDYVLRSANVFVDRHYDSNSSSGYNYKSKTTIAKLPYIDRSNYGFTVRIGGEHYGVFANYRLNNLFNVSTPNNRDLPKLTIGIEAFGYE
jgi:hypothetical protein